MLKSIKFNGKKLDPNKWEDITCLVIRRLKIVPVFQSELTDPEDSQISSLKANKNAAQPSRFSLPYNQHSGVITVKSKWLYGHIAHTSQSLL